jgi:hypothetical protein
MLTQLQADILGVNPKGFTIIEFQDTPSLPDSESTLISLLIGKPDPTGKRIPEAYLKDLQVLKLSAFDTPFIGGLLPVCQSINSTFVTVLKRIDQLVFTQQSTQDFEDFYQEYWETRWLAFRKPETQSLAVYQKRLQAILSNIGSLVLPQELKLPQYQQYLSRQILHHLGLYALSVADKPIPFEPVDEWSDAVELNWLYTLEARANVFESHQRRLLKASPAQALALIDDIELLRPSMGFARALLIMEGASVSDARARVNKETYEYCVAKVCEHDHNSLLSLAYRRSTGIETHEENLSV